MKTPVPESLLIKLQAEACNFIKKGASDKGVYCEIFKNTFFYRKP